MNQACESGRTSPLTHVRKENKKHMPMIPLPRNYQEAAESMLRLLEHGTRHERQEGTTNSIEVIGEWQAFDPDELDMWGGRLKFVFRDNEPTSEQDRDTRQALAQQTPPLAAFLMSKTLLTVYIQEEGPEHWRDVTREFALKVSKYGF